MVVGVMVVFMGWVLEEFRVVGEGGYWRLLYSFGVISICRG